MNDFTAGILVGIVGVYALNWILKRIMVFLVLKIAKDKIEEMKRNEAEILLKLEKQGNTIYCYRKDNDEFIGQADNLEAIADLFKKKYPHNDGRVLREDSAGLMP